MLPKPPYILLSFVNAQLRDQAENLSDLCSALDVGENLRQTLAGVDYHYNSDYHQFISD